MLWLERIYISRFLSQDHCKDSLGHLWNFRCPLCGDSEKNKWKMRGYLKADGNHYYYYCHNCAQSRTFEEFLEQTQPSLYDEFIIEKLKNKGYTPKETFSKRDPIISQPDLLLNFDLPKINQLSSTHSARQYISDRCIPKSFWSDLYYAEDWVAFASEYFPEKYSDSSVKEKRIVIPLREKNKNIFAFQGRSLGANPNFTLRYITLVFDKEMPKLYGLDRININKTWYVCEGPFDSMFVDNCLATCGGNIQSELKTFNANKDLGVIIYDNEPRNPDIVKLLYRSINDGYNVVIWPEEIKQKDINDIFLEKISNDPSSDRLVKDAKSYIKHILEANTFRGLDAELKFTQWKKI